MRYIQWHSIAYRHFSAGVNNALTLWSKEDRRILGWHCLRVCSQWRIVEQDLKSHKKVIELTFNQQCFDNVIPCLGLTKVNLDRTHEDEPDGSIELHKHSLTLVVMLVFLSSYSCWTPPPLLACVTMGTFNEGAAGVLGGRSLSQTSLLLDIESLEDWGFNTWCLFSLSGQSILFGGASSPTASLISSPRVFNLSPL